MVIDCLLPWQQFAIYWYSYECVANLHCECQLLKPKVETNSSFLVLRPSSGVDTVNNNNNNNNNQLYLTRVDT